MILKGFHQTKFWPFVEVMTS